jgi:hypothetical protein
VTKTHLETSFERMQALLILFGTLIITMLRTLRLPNDWAEAHWLITYEFGYVKRGLPGALVNALGLYNSTMPTQDVISLISVLLLLLLGGVLFGLCAWLLHRSGYAITTLLWGILLLSSPFIVTSTDLIGYYDHIFEIGAILTLILVLRHRYYAAGILQFILVLIHESYMLVGYPVIVLALIFQMQQNPKLSKFALLFALIAPVAVFGGLVIIQSSPDKIVLYRALVEHLQAYSFIQGGRHTMVPDALVESFWVYLREPMNGFMRYITDTRLITLVLPTTF